MTLLHIADMAIAVITVRKGTHDTFIIEIADGLGSISAVIDVPEIQGDRIYTEAERERMARFKAQELGLKLADTMFSDKASH